LSSLIVMGGFLLSKAIGVVRQSIIARTFGAGDPLDAYYAAFKLPDLLLTLIAGGAIATTFIPVFAEHLARGDTGRAWRLASAVLNALLGAMAFIALVAAPLAPWLVRTLVAPGFDPALQALTAELMRLVLLSSTLFAVSSLAMSVLQAHKHFLLPALADFFYDVGIIGGALFLAPHLGIHGLAWGVEIGAGLHLLIQVPGLLHYGARYVPTLRVGDRSLLQLGRLMGPRILILGMFQFVFLFTTNLASRLEKGSITAINVGWIVMQMPEVVFGTAIATAAFPTLSQLAAQGAQGKLQEAVSGTLQAILWTTFPSGVALLLLGRPYIALLFRSGAFDERAVEMVYGAAVAFTAGLLGHSILELAARLFYAHKNTLTPFWVALGATTLNLALCLALAPPLGHAGLALANSIAVTLQSGLLLWLGGRSLVRLSWRRVWSHTWKATLASAAMAGGILLVTQQEATLGHLNTALLGSAAGGIAYVLCMALLNRQEMRRLAGVVQSRLAR
ncbi:MAG: murein biosynthesis integral membrane protein MurJ, partial [Anaerolineae bacterium]